MVCCPMTSCRGNLKVYLREVSETMSSMFSHNLRLESVDLLPSTSVGSQAEDESAEDFCLDGGRHLPFFLDLDGFVLAECSCCVPASLHSSKSF